MLEWIAMLTMLVDHIGAVFFPGAVWMRIVGRIAMPLYTYGIVRGYELTRSRRRYALRLFLIALAAQVPFWALWYPDVNIVAGFLAGIGVFAGLDNTPRLVERLFHRPLPALTRTLQGALLAAAFFLFWLVPVDYGPYLLALLLLYRYVKWKWVLPVAQAVLVVLLLGPHWQIQLFSLVGTLLLILPVRYPPLMRGRWFYRAFYPAHLAVIAAVAWTLYLQGRI
ncbi:MAG: TraX family protein [Symbiobacterium sp.]|uniref:TraX family protein n=1 Tax=Symbiobacterium sp. TaxID=1971213 RepID=UPI00346461B8